MPPKIARMVDKETAQVSGDLSEKFTLITTDMLKADSSLYSGYAERPYNPDDVAKMKGTFGIYDEMRRDDQVKAVLWLKKFMILGRGWDISVEHEEMQEIGDEIKDNLQSLESPDFDSALMNMLTHLDYGFSITEPIFTTEEKVLLKSLKTRAPHAFTLITDEYANLTGVEQNTASGTITVDGKGLIFLQHQYEFGVPYGVSDLQAAYRPWFSKKMVIKFWNIYLERFGNPFVVATFPGNLGKADKDKLLDILKNLQAKTGITVPEGVNIEVLSPSSGTTDFEKAVNIYNSQIARSLLIPDLVGVGGSETSGGSYSLGQKQFEAFFLTLEKIRGNLEAKINRYVVAPLLWWNYGKELKEGIRWKLNSIDKDDKLRLLEIWTNAASYGVWKASDDEVNYFRKTTGFPQGDVERINTTKPTINEEGNPLLDDVPPSSKRKVKLAQTVKNTRNFSTKREFTSYEKRVDFQKIENDMKEIVEQSINALIPPLVLIREALLETIRKEKIIEGKKTEKIVDMKLKYLKDLQIAWRVVLKDTFDRGWDTAEDEFKAIKPDTKKMQFVSPSALFEEMISDRSFFITGVMRDAIRKDAGQIILNGIEKGHSTQDVIHRLNEYFTKHYTPIVIQGQEVGLEEVPGRLETITRTNMIKAYNQGRRNFFESEEAEDFVQGYQFSAILDDRTTPVCEALDEETYRVGDPYIEKITPPLHFNCRSILIPITIDEKMTPSKKVVSEDDLASFEGKIR